ncbi:MAG: NAD-dependent epimerase/dehydratase family protein [Candidatus Nanoarchaeia archaeon]|nr:NAD-dependent epimerase/dehydratase family protein [Candidatus Nanoarchaeia archaeon]
MREIKKILVNKDKTIKETMKVIDEGEIRTAVVVDSDGKLCGMVTDGDIRRGILRGIGINEKISEVMNKNPTYIKVGAPREQILNVIKKNPDIFNLPLVDENNVVKDFVILSQGADVSYFSNAAKIRNHLRSVLVIGGAGYIGSVLVRKLLDKGYKVNILDNFTYGKDSLKSIESNPNLRIIEGDTRHISYVSEALQDVDAVVHLAEIVGDPACALDTKRTQEINYLATRAIALMCKHFQINRMVYASSCSVYGASKKNELLNEESELNPVSLYAKMKIASENALNEMTDENFRPTILRLSTVFGFSYRPRFDLVVNTLTAKAIKDGKITIFGGDQWRPNVHVSDVAETIIKVLESPIENVGGKVFNVGTERNNHTINKIGEFVKEIIPSANVVIEDKDVDKRDYKVDFSRLRKTLDVDMKMGVDDGVREIKEAFEKNPDLDHTHASYSNIKWLENNNLKK